MVRGGVPGGWGAEGGRRRVGTGVLSSSPPTPRGAPPPPPPRGAFPVPGRSGVGAPRGHRSGGGVGWGAVGEARPLLGPGGARCGPHGRLSLRCCCCCYCCWRLSSSAPRARAGRRPPTPPPKVPSSSPTSGPPPSHSGSLRTALVTVLSALHSSPVQHPLPPDPAIPSRPPCDHPTTLSSIRSLPTSLHGSTCLGPSLCSVTPPPSPGSTFLPQFLFIAESLLCCSDSPTGYPY